MSSAVSLRLIIADVLTGYNIIYRDHKPFTQLDAFQQMVILQLQAFNQIGHSMNDIIRVVNIQLICLMISSMICRLKIQFISVK